MMKKLLAFLMCALLFIVSLPALAFEESAGRVYLYVSLDGNDAASGDIDSPLASFIGARNKIRELKNQGVAPAKGFVVYVRGGNYQFKESVLFTQEDSGTEAAPIVYRAYPGEKVKIIGGASLPETAFKPLDDPKIKSRIIDAEAKNRVLCADLKALGFKDYGEIFMPGSYTYWVPGTVKPDVANPELFVNGNLMTVARYPNDGYMNIDEIVNMGAMPTRWEDSWKNEPTWVPPAERDITDTFEIKSNDKRYLKWADVPEGEAIISGFLYYAWADHSAPLKRVDVENGTIKSTIPSYFGVSEEGRFYVWNLVEEIDVPGEYILDRDNGKLYIYPPDDFKGSEINLSILQHPLFKMEEANYITIKNFNMTAARSNAVLVENGIGNKVVDCEISFTADFAVEIQKTHSSKNGVESCYIHDTNGGIILNAGDRITLTPGGNYVENCLIERFSRITKTYNGAVAIDGVGAEVIYNEIRDEGHLAIQFAGNNHKINYNNIHDVINSQDDMGAIYGGFSWAGRGTEIKYNYIHDLELAEGITEAGGIRAIYLDNKQAGFTMAGNVFRNIEGDAITVNGGRENIILNNLLIDVRDGNDVVECTFKDYTDHVNGLAEVPYKEGIWAETYPELVNILDEPDPNMPKNNIVENNAYVNTGESTIHKYVFDNGIVRNNAHITVPGFEDPDNGNYMLKEDSEVFKKIPGFQALPFPRMGRYSERAIKRVENAIVLAADSSQTIVDGETKFIDEDNQAVKAQIIDGSTYVPIRFIAEALGGDVAYNDETKEITIKGAGTSVVMQVGNKEATVNNAPVELPQLPIIRENRTLVPLRAISELFNKKVYWNDIGLITISDRDDLFSETSDEEIIEYLYELICSH